MIALKMYSVDRIDDHQLNRDEKKHDALWDTAEVLSDFSSPWNSEAVKTIEFRSLWDS